jgi:hypothetical protein
MYIPPIFPDPKERSMAFAANFDSNMRKVLDQIAPAYEWTKGWSTKGERWKVDVAGRLREGDGQLVLIEVELKRDGPLGNVVKVWRWARNSNNATRILFVQAFSEHFWKTKRVHWERATFVGERMKEDSRLKIDYTWIHMNFTPRILPGHHTKEGGGSMVHAARGLAKNIAKLVHSTRSPNRIRAVTNSDRLK